MARLLQINLAYALTALKLSSPIGFLAPITMLLRLKSLRGGMMLYVLVTPSLTTFVITQAAPDSRPEKKKTRRTAPHHLPTPSEPRTHAVTSHGTPNGTNGLQ
jgi:hypothetical protein